MDKLKWLEDLGINLMLMIAGLFGSILSLKGKKVNAWQKVVAVLSGVGIANYMTPFIFEYININKGAMGGIAFLLGYVGLEGVQWGIVTLRDKFQKK